MTHHLNLELSLDRSSRTFATRAGVLALHRHLLLGSPPAAGVINRVTHCVGTELRAPGDAKPLLVSLWAANAEHLRDAERIHGINHHAYLVAALHCVVAPLDAALGLRVSAPDGALWVPEDTPAWDAWRAAHPGKLDVTADEPADRDERRIRLERWALGPRFTQDIKATSAWPNVVNAE